MARTLDATPLSSKRTKKHEPILIETILGVLSVVTLMVGALLVFAIVHAGGKAGETLFNGLYALFGVYAYLLPFVFFYCAYYLWEEEMPSINLRSFIAWACIILGSGSFGSVVIDNHFGGLLGAMLARPLLAQFSVLPTVTILAGVFFIGVLVLANRKPSLNNF